MHVRNHGMLAEITWHVYKKTIHSPCMKCNKVQGTRNMGETIKDPKSTRKDMIDCELQRIWQ